MELKQLRSFVAVAQALSFSRAAVALHLSQPALSAQIMALEADVGVTLLERNRRMVKLTPAGTSLLADAAQLLAAAEAAKQRAARMDSGEAGHLRVAFVASATPELVPAIVAAFRAKYPLVTLELKNLPTVRQVEALLAQSLDVGFLRLPLTAPELDVTLLHSEPFAIALSKNHALARSRSLTVADLAKEPFIAYGERWAPEFYQTWTGICRRAGFTPVITQETAEMDTALALVSAALGVAILPEGVAMRHRQSLKIKSLVHEKVRSQMGLAVLLKSDNPVAERFVAMAKRTAK